MFHFLTPLCFTLLSKIEETGHEYHIFRYNPTDLGGWRVPLVIRSALGMMRSRRHLGLPKIDPMKMIQRLWLIRSTLKNPAHLFQNGDSVAGMGYLYVCLAITAVIVV